MASDLRMKFLNEVIFGLIELSYDWEGSGMATMGSLVGCAVVDDFDLPRDVLEGKKVDEILALLEKHLSRYGVAEKVSLSIEEKSGVGIKVDNCLLLPVEKKMKENEMRLRRLFCPVANIVREVFERSGINTEVRSWHIDSVHCSHVVGLIDELAMEKELKAE